MENIEKMEKRIIEKGINDTEKKCIRMPVPLDVFEREDYQELDYDMFSRAKKEFPEVEFCDPMERNTEKKGDTMEFLYPYK